MHSLKVVLGKFLPPSGRHTCKNKDSCLKSCNRSCRCRVYYGWFGCLLIDRRSTGTALHCPYGFLTLITIESIGCTSWTPFTNTSNALSRRLFRASKRCNHALGLVQCSTHIAPQLSISYYLLRNIDLNGAYHHCKCNLSHKVPIKPNSFHTGHIPKYQAIYHVFSITCHKFQNKHKYLRLHTQENKISS